MRIEIARNAEWKEKMKKQRWANKQRMKREKKKVRKQCLRNKKTIQFFRREKKN